MSNRYTYLFIKNKFAEKGFTLISTVYLNAFQKLEYRCPKGHINKMSWNKFSINRGCPDCHFDYLKTLNGEKSKAFKHGLSYNLEWKRQQNKLRHEKYPWEYHYYAAKARCCNPKNSHYNSYGKRGIKFLLTKEECAFIWERDRAYLLKQPSIDRIDINGNYTFENCRFIEQQENSRNNRKIMKVAQYSLDGNIIKIWNSQMEIKRELGFNQAWIGQLIKNEPHIGYNFIWRKYNV